jgi:hypothetical protein
LKTAIEQTGTSAANDWVDEQVKLIDQPGFHQVACK